MIDQSKIPPVPHYPNWRYACPIGFHPWEFDVKLKQFLIHCPTHKPWEWTKYA